MRETKLFELKISYKKYLQYYDFDEIIWQSSQRSFDENIDDHIFL